MKLIKSQCYKRNQSCYMKAVKVRTNGQVTIPKSVRDQVGVATGDYIDVSHSDNKIIMERKALVDPDDMLMPAEEVELAVGLAQAGRGDVFTLEEAKKELGL